jgi:uncharacterized phage-associated protein
VCKIILSKLKNLFVTVTRRGRMYGVVWSVEDSGMPYDAAAIANWFLEKGNAEGETATPMKLQKLVFFAHGWHLALMDKPLVNEKVQAWPYGPVIPSLYHELKQYGNNQVTRPVCVICRDSDGKAVAIRPTVAIEDTQTRDLLEAIWTVYGKPYSGIQLSNMTHLPGTPWQTIHKENKGRIPPDTEIPETVIKDYFKTLASAKHA